MHFQVINTLWRVSLAFHGFDPKKGLILWKPREGEELCRFEDLEHIMETQGDEIALLMIGSTNYYSGQSFPLKKDNSIGSQAQLYGWF